MTWAQDKRLDFIDEYVAISGTIGRADLVRQFEISTQQASYDLRDFQKRYPRAIVYDKSGKTYRANYPYKRKRQPFADDKATIARLEKRVAELEAKLAAIRAAAE